MSFSENFSEHSGELVDYFLNDFSSIYSDTKHYNIRSFHTANIWSPFSALDKDFWGNYRYADLDIGDAHSLVDTTFIRRTVSELETFTMAHLDGMYLWEIENIQTSWGNEHWPFSDPDVLVGPVSTYRWANRIQITVTTPGNTKTVNSTYQDDLWTDFQNDDYFISLILRNFPAQTDASFFDLANSYIEMSVGVDDYSGTTYQFNLADSTNDLNGGGNLEALWLRPANMDLADVQAVRFVLKNDASSSGAAVFIAQSMRLIPSLALTQPKEQIDTKREILSRSVPQNASEPSTFIGPIYWQTRPKNSRMALRFNAGHNPTGNDNTLRVFLRANNSGGGNYIEVEFDSRDTQSRLHIKEKIAGVETTLFSTPINSNILSQDFDTDLTRPLHQNFWYYLIIDLEEDSIVASIYNYSLTASYSVGSLYYTTDTQTVHLLDRGYTGYSLEPYNYDFYLDFIAPETVSFGQFTSTAIGSITPVEGASLETLTSPADELLTNFDFESWGDAVASTVGNFTEAVRDGTQLQGGLKFTTPFALADSSQGTIVLDLYPSSPSGIYYAALIDDFDEVGFLGSLGGPVPNTWNSYRLPIEATILPTSYKLIVVQEGHFPDTFRVRNVAMESNTVSWEGSADNSTHWQPFLDTVNRPWGVLHFNVIDKHLKVKGIAHTDTAWIGGYTLIPRYLPPGRST